MKSVVALCLVLYSVTAVHGQVKNEIKLELYNTFFEQNYILAYERIIQKRLGIEAELGLDINDKVVNNPQMPIDISLFSQARLRPALSGKYYFLFTKYGDGFYVGSYGRLEFLLHLEDGYYEKWNETYNWPEDDWSDRSLSGIFYGLQLGYKLRIKERFIAEITSFWMIEHIRVPEGVIRYGRADQFDLYLKAGYRF